MMQVDHRAAFQRTGGWSTSPQAGGFGYGNINGSAGVEFISGNEVAAPDAFVWRSFWHLRQVQTGAHSGRGMFHVRVMTLNRPNARPKIAGLRINVLAGPERSSGQGASDNGTNSGQRKGPIDKKPRFADVALGLGLGKRGGEGLS